jgi:hypothetical protein
MEIFDIKIAMNLLDYVISEMFLQNVLNLDFTDNLHDEDEWAMNRTSPLKNARDLYYFFVIFSAHTYNENSYSLS